ncbi:hypothetical protein NY406_03410 [Chlorobaculum sp. MV4-Y]|jgi:DNA polymerase V|uniref:LexA family protein n=1 Tax=Chlorobaculum sp. MV4-Y TaxID=2976335 RepID=UPI0021AE4423|nr:S24 family peptidase [Chlorobaculum sp. MV4-Y]UWX58332.1 hypothetical protein NY406_03410 [Chlorobaculum sp. MV4-Y]
MRLVRISTGSKLDFYRPDFSTDVELPLISVGISDGSLSPTEDFEEGTFDLTKALVKNPATTFYARFKGASMTDADIFDGDFLVIDKAVESEDGLLS